MKRSGFLQSGEALTLFEEVEDILAGAGMEFDGVFHQAGEELVTMEFSQGKDLSNVMPGIEALCLELMVEGIRFGS